MKANTNPQHGAAIALVQLLEEHPDLPVAEWSMTSVTSELRGFVYRGGMAELALYAEVLGGSITAADRAHEDQGQQVRAHRLSSVWRDVSVLITVVLPVAESARVAA
ncbi:hypothetical protein KVH15_33330 [Streptomyces olivaceus]|uniref:hypothetical protein n=1 Tax=Streptomyces olivaceus TaxID=47716 RepID=UPI001CCFE905|nr:hypothetical protein [Streptomyces olivaceus]MBZ6085867.1 hypothetical protein [Streptomyces olivaceus]